MAALRLGRTLFQRTHHAPLLSRSAHVVVPDWAGYKKEPMKKEDRDDTSRAFTYTVAGGTAVVGAYMAKNIVQDFLDSMSASADVLALAQVEIELTAIPEGKNVTFKWRGKPLFIRHRGSAEIETCRSVDVSSLRHPEKDEERVQTPAWLVVLGICTHLGCVPIANAGDFGGYFCPCHGSHYDAAGRIRKGPAPLNLEIPPYQIIEDGAKVVVG